VKRNTTECTNRRCSRD